jgi:acetyl esterase
MINLIRFQLANPGIINEEGGMIKAIRAIPLLVKAGLLAKHQDLHLLPGGEMDPQLEVLMKMADLFGGTALNEMMAVEARRNRDRLSGMLARLKQPGDMLASVQDMELPISEGSIPVRVYTPPGSGPFPLLVYFHGGGWVIGSIATHDAVARALAARGGCVTISVNYRLAPEDPFPAAVEDAYAAVAWAAQEALTLNGDSRRIAVAGDSAGGNLAAVIAIMARERRGPALTAQVLIYPVTDLSNFSTSSYEMFAEEGHGLNRSDMAWFREHYLSTSDICNDPMASPLLNEDLSGLPPAIVVTAEFDVLRDEGEAYAARLEAAGVQVVWKRYNGMMHGFVNLFGLVPRANACLDDLAAALRGAFTAGE